MEIGAHGAILGQSARHARDVLARALAFAMILASATAEEVKVPGGSIDLELRGSPSAAWRSVALKWVENAARAVSTYYGKFPVPRATLHIASCAGTQPRGGRAFGWRGPLITISLGRDATVAAVADDWLLTHEMVHLAFPSLPDQNHWLEEGLATYVEPIARARAGIITPERVWSDLVNGLAQGQPETGDRGLDRTPTWGRTYWGGALFCFRADVAIRQRTGNRFGLEQALRAILAAGGSIEQDWTIEQVIEVGDRSVGVPVLQELYEEMGSKPVTVDLESLWRQLGIQRQGSAVAFDDRAPLAGVRRSITESQ
jgi:hypothetical protein